MSIAAQDSTDYKTDGPEGSNVEKDSDTIASGVNPATEDSDAQLRMFLTSDCNNCDC